VLRPSTIRADLLLLLAAVIWGFAFVAQRMAMDSIGPFLFNGIRFALGAGLLVSVVKVRGWFEGRTLGRYDGKTLEQYEDKTADRRPLTVYGILLGLILFAGASLQQAGIVYTSAGNAGFITGLYVILVPVLGIFTGQKAGVNLWGGAIMATVGLYFLSVNSSLTMSQGDLLVLAGAFFWAIHVLYTGWLSPKTSVLRLAITQYTVCALLSFSASFLFESFTVEGLRQAVIPLLYGGILSVGVAFTLQIIGQKTAPPAHTAIILSMEAVFAETLTERKWFGCSLMLAGMLLAQVNMSRRS
jgi:drug/metabolite transporter (DMT)-like permease